MTLSVDLKAKAEAIAEALNAKDIRNYVDPSVAMSPPAVLIGAPTLNFQAYCREPSSATYTLYLVVPLGAKPMEQLWDLVPKVTEALDEMPDAAVTTARPGGVFNNAGTDLPCYEIPTEVSL
jgi:hypothetical protein